MVWRAAADRLAHPPQQAADAALVLGNRAYLNGKPNPCLTGRVDAALALAQAGLVPRLVFSGGVDREDGRIEAEVMQAHAQHAGYTGPMVLERASQSTRENLALSLPLLEAEGVKRVIVVSEPYHLWRVERLVRASGFDRGLDVQYAAAPSSCWTRWGMAFKGALREPLAIINNAANGYLH
ncbi:MAG: YdcF family protein [Comamonadaceae bacterium]|nr:MAG: YdcF family protein [Comamonadaceae bacterium]